MHKDERWKVIKNLKQCPFCGGDPYPEDSHRAFVNGETTRVSFIRCRECNARTGRVEIADGIGKRKALSQAMAMWNKREIVLDDVCRGCRHINKSGDKMPCVECSCNYRMLWEAKDD